MDTEAGEHVIFEGHPSWRAIIGFYIVGLLAVGAAAAIAAGSDRDWVTGRMAA